MAVFGMRFLLLFFSDQDVNFDAILGELYELESQLSNTQTELSRSLGAGGHHPPPPAAFQDGNTQDMSETTHASEQVRNINNLSSNIDQAYENIGKKIN